MNSIITDKMKTEFLLLLPKWYAEVGTTTPLTQYDFPLATKWYTEQLPLLKQVNSDTSDHQVNVVKHLEDDGLVTMNRNGLTFRLKPEGVQRIQQLTEPKDPQPLAADKSMSLKNFVFLVGVAVVGGIILYFVLPGSST